MNLLRVGLIGQVLDIFHSRKRSQITCSPGGPSSEHSSTGGKTQGGEGQATAKQD